jgi:hypothetical protein
MVTADEAVSLVARTDESGWRGQPDRLEQRRSKKQVRGRAVAQPGRSKTHLHRSTVRELGAKGSVDTKEGVRE